MANVAARQRHVVAAAARTAARLVAGGAAAEPAAAGRLAVPRPQSGRTAVVAALRLAHALDIQST